MAPPPPNSRAVGKREEGKLKKKEVKKKRKVSLGPSIGNVLLSGRTHIQGRKGELTPASLPAPALLCLCDEPIPLACSPGEKPSENTTEPMLAFFSASWKESTVSVWWTTHPQTRYVKREPATTSLNFLGREEVPVITH